MAEFFGADIHQKVLAIRILAVKTLDRILHRRRELAIGAAELFQQHVSKAGIRLVHAYREHQLLYVVIHCKSSSRSGECRAIYPTGSYPLVARGRWQPNSPLPSSLDRYCRTSGKPCLCALSGPSLPSAVVCSQGTGSY